MNRAINVAAVCVIRGENKQADKAPVKLVETVEEFNENYAVVKLAVSETEELDGGNAPPRVKIH